MTEFILVLSAVFIAAGLLLLVANQLGLPPVPFYLIAGLIVGQFVDEGIVLDLALWGVAFLVFVFGIRVDLGDLRSVLRDGESAAFIQLLVVAPIAFVIGYVFGESFGFGEPARNALYFSAAATLGSTLVGTHVMQEGIRNNLVYGRLAATIHFFDDLVAIGAIAVLSAAVLTDAQLVTSNIGYAVLLLLSGLLVYRHGYAVLRRVAGGSDELVLMGSISILIAFVAAAEHVGISVVVGAFAAGLAVRTDGRESLDVQNGIDSIKDFFTAIFFVTVGSLVTIPSADVLVLATVLVVLVVVINPLVHTVAFLFEGYDGRTAFLAGSSLNQVSELSLVIAIQATLLGTIEQALFEAIILAAAITMILSAFVSRHRDAFYDLTLRTVLGSRTSYIDEHSAVEDDLSNHAVIIGFGRQGRRLALTLEELGEPYVVVENDPAVRGPLSETCRNYVFGDVMAEYPVELAGISDAQLVVSTVDHRPVSDELLRLETDADIVLSADRSSEARELLDRGATFVSVPGVLASDQLVENVERVLNDEQGVTALRDEHRAYLRSLEFGELERQVGRS